jgi:hypothetical protein
MNTPENEYVLKQPVRAAFLNVVTPTAPKLEGGRTGQATYNGTFLFEPDSDDLKNLKATLAAVARAKWPDKPLPEIHFPLVSGEKKAADAIERGRDGTMYLGSVVLNAKTGINIPPHLFVLSGNKVLELRRDSPEFAEHKEKFYHGCYVLLRLALVPYQSSGSKYSHGITAYIKQVLWVKDGPRVGRVADPVEVFRDYIGKLTPDFDPIAAGEIPL